MKTTTFTSRRKKIELITFLVCFILANLANLYSIVTYGTSFVELITSLGYVTVAALLLYILWSIIRLIFYAIVRFFRRSRTV